MTAPDTHEGAERDYAREVAGTAESVIWELDQPDPDWPAVRQLAEKLLRTALQAPGDGVEQPDSAPATVVDIAQARSLVPEARRQLDEVERAVTRGPCDVALAYEAVHSAGPPRVPLHAVRLHRVRAPATGIDRRPTVVDPTRHRPGHTRRRHQRDHPPPRPRRTPRHA